MNKVDAALLGLLIADARISYADIARKLNVSRAYARSRVNALVNEGVIEQFTAVVNPEKLGKVVSNFVDLKVHSQYVETIANELSTKQEVVSLYIMSDLQSLHIHTLTDSFDSFQSFVRENILGRPEIISSHCNSLLCRVKNRRGGARL